MTEAGEDLGPGYPCSASGHAMDPTSPGTCTLSTSERQILLHSTHVERKWREVNGPTANLFTWKSLIFSILFCEGARGSQSKGEAGDPSDRLPKGQSKCFLISIYTDSAAMDSGALLHLLMGSAWLS